MRVRSLFQTPVFTAVSALLFFSCSKLDTTTLGSDLLPGTDQVATHVDTFDVVSQTMFLPDTSSKVFAGSEHVIGKIDNDPIFGSTVAETYFQFKPAGFPFSFKNATDTIVGIDSIVLALNYSGIWGERTMPPSFDVYEIDNEVTGAWDSSSAMRNVGYRPHVSTPLVMNAPFKITGAGAYQKIMFGKDSVLNQIRIRLADQSLNTAFMNTLFLQDTLATSPNNAFRSDSLYRDRYKGLAIKPSASPSNALVYVSPSSPNTRLEIYYRKRNAGVTDTLAAKFTINTASNTTANRLSSHANYIQRNYAGSEVESGNTEANYIQTQPGSYVQVTLANMDSLSNRVVHRAYLHVEQVPDNYYYDTTFSVPQFMYYDLRDSVGENRWKPIYNDLNPLGGYDPDNASYFFFSNGANGVDAGYMGARPVATTTAAGTKVYHYDLNVTRYVQRLISQKTHNYPIRVFPASDFNYPQYFGTSQTVSSFISYFNPLAYGRIKVGSGAASSHRMRLVVEWSEIK